MFIERLQMVRRGHTLDSRTCEIFFRKIMSWLPKNKYHERALRVLCPAACEIAFKFVLAPEAFGFLDTLVK